MKKFLIIIEQAEAGYSAYGPDLPGCMATGETKSDIETNIYEAITFHLEGLAIPESKSEAEVLLIAV